jgi:Ca2+-binding EF-hand superfamily protein
MNKSIWPVLAIVSFAFAVPASAQQKTDKQIPPGGLAQNESECQAQFNSADRNSDGVLSKNEVSEAKTMIPTELGSESSISRQDFLSACSATTKSRSQN